MFLMKFAISFQKEMCYNKGVVKTNFVHGGMEYPCMVTISDSYTDEFDIAKVISHEIAHQWWYAVVGNNEINES